jgi:uncharacterized protein (DUF983 family)
MTFGTVLSRSLRRRCPSCGVDKVFVGLLRVKEVCASCGYNCRPEGGFYIGAIYINYGVTAVIGLGIGLAFAAAGLPVTGMIVAFAVATVIAVAFFQTSRSLWLGIDYWIHHR